MNTDWNHYYRSIGTVDKLRLVVVATSTDHVHAASVVLVLPILSSLVDVVFLALLRIVDKIVMVELVIDSDGYLVHC